MALKRIITAQRFISLRWHHAEQYIEQPDGTYKLDLVEADGTPSPPPPKPEEVAGLKSALQKIEAERDDLRGLKRQLRDAKAADDPDNAISRYSKSVSKKSKRGSPLPTQTSNSGRRMRTRTTR